MNDNERTGGDRPRRRRGRRSSSGGGQANRNNGQHSDQGSTSSGSANASNRSGNGGNSNGGNNGGRSGNRRSARSRGGRNRRRGQNAHQPNAQKTRDEREQNNGSNSGGTSNGGRNNKNNSNRNRRGHHQSRNHQDPLFDLHSDLPVSVETSAGGLVLSGLAEAVQDDGSVDLSTVYVALIGRLDRRGRLLWSMPKGHIEPNESTYATAEREVWEETGVAGTVMSELGTIDYWFVSEGVRIHKTVHHHLLRFVDGELNDEDPEVTEVQWLPVNQLVERLAYADERRLARDAFDQLPDLARAEAKAGRVTPR